MASYDIIGGIVDPKALAELQNLEKIAKSIGESLKGVNLSSLIKGEKDLANLEKINQQTQLLIEKQKTQIALQEKAAAAAQASAQKATDSQIKNAQKQQELLAKIKIEEEKLQLMRENNDKKNALAQQKYLDQLQKQATIAANRVNNSTPEAKVTNAAQGNIAKLNAVLTNQYTTALQKLDAQIKLNIIDAQKYVQAGDTQNPMYLQNIANTKKLSQEYDRLAKASGATMQKTSSMYGATFSLTQVMRELPNFAIDARIGFMALSNNLPMLAENFSRVKHEIDAITGKEKGFIGAFKEFGKSLLSLNTIMIVLSTVMILFGDDIVKFIGNLSKGADSVDKLTLSQRALINVMKESSSAAKSQISNVIELGAKIRKYGDDSKYSKDIIDEFNKTFDTHYTSMVEIKNEYPKLANAAIQAAIKMAAADKLIQDASAQTLRNMQAKQTLSVYSKKDIDTYKKITDEMFSLMDSVGISVNRKNKIFSEFATNTWDKNISYFSGAQREMLDLAEQYNDGIVNEQTISGKKYMEVMRNLRKSVNDSGKGIVDDQKKRGEEIISALFNEQGAKVAVSGLEKAIDELYEYKPETDTIDVIDVIIKDIQSKIETLKPIDLTTLLFPTSAANQPSVPQFGDFITQSMNSQLNSLNEQYDAGIIGYKDYLDKRIALTNIAGEAGIEIQNDVNQKMADIDDEHYEQMLQYKAEIAQTTVDIIESIWIGFYERYIDKLEETAEKEKRIEDERLSDIDDREKAGVITKQQAEEEKLRIEAYSMSVQYELDRQKEETERKQFILEQAAAIARIWVDFATASGSLENLLAGGAFTPLYLGIALASTGLAAAQTIPYFKDGVESSPEGLAVLGDGYKHELAITPSGKYFISDNKPTMYNLEKGTQILPDINRMDLASILALKQVMPEMRENVETNAILKSIEKGIKSQRQGNFYGMPLIKQIENRNKYSSRSRSLMN